MSNDSGTSSDDTGKRSESAQHGGADGHASDIPEDSPSSESEVSLSQQVADREPDGEKTDG